MVLLLERASSSSRARGGRRRRAARARGRPPGGSTRRALRRNVDAGCCGGRAPPETAVGGACGLHGRHRPPRGLAACCFASRRRRQPARGRACARGRQPPGAPDGIELSSRRGRGAREAILAAMAEAGTHRACVRRAGARRQPGYAAEALRVAAGHAADGACVWQPWLRGGRRLRVGDEIALGLDRQRSRPRDSSRSRHGRRGPPGMSGTAP